MKNFRIFSYIAGLILSFTLGAAVTITQSSAANEQADTSGEKPAYLVASWEVLHPDQLKPFGAAVVPLANKAGYTLLGASQPQVLEGSWPHKDILIVQRYRSMQALLDFWHSAEHAAAIKLRAGHVDSRFVVAVEASPLTR